MKRLLAIAMLLPVIIAGLLWWKEFRIEHSQDSNIVAAAERYKIDPALIKAVVWRESRFDPTARGRAEEIGLMQIRDVAAFEWADAEKIDPFDHEHLVHPRTNILCGSWYLQKLIKRYQKTDDPVPYALADYNAGRAHVLRWNRGEASTNSALFIEQITFPGTKKYIQAVMERRDYYRPYFRSSPKT